MDALLTIAGARRQLDLAPAPLFLRKRHLRHRVILILKEARMSKTHSISTLTTGLAVLAAACWLVTGAFPLTAEPQVVNDAAGVTVNLNGAAVLHRTAVHYPPAALQQGVQGTVQVEVKLDAGGNVSDARVLSGPDELRRAALESVLDWHFTRDVAGTTRVVGIAFELPKRDAVGDYITGLRADPAGGVSGGAPRGVVGGIIGAVPANAPPPPPPPLPPGQPNRIASIRVEGLSDQATSDLLASLPLHEGDEMTNENMQRAAQAVRAFDEHLSTLWSTHRTQDGAATDLIISVAGTQPELRRMVTNAIPPAASLAPAVAGPPAQIRVGGNVQATLIVTKVPPVYPALAKQARVSGVVHLDAIIAKDGTIQELHSLGGPALLLQAAMDAVRQWTYRPTMLNGEPVMVETTIDVNFTLNQ
jgi:protein TonB